MLQWGSGDFTSSLNFDASPQAITLGQSTALEGKLYLSQGASALDATLQVDRTNPDGTHTALPDITVDDLGAFSVPDTPPQRGAYTYTITYPGTATRSGTQAQAPLDVNGSATTLTLHASATTINYRSALMLTAALSAHGSNSVVSIYRHPAGGTRTLLTSQPVNSAGHISITVNPKQTTSYQAVYTGDGVYNPATSRGVKVAVRVAIRGRQSGYYATSGSYRLYHYLSSCVNHGTGCPTYTAHVKPSHTGERIKFTLQLHASSRWVTVAHGTATLDSKSSASIFLRYTKTTIIDKPFRERATFPSDTRNATNTTSWAYFKVTR